MFQINPSAATPIYQQVVDQVRRKVSSGQLQAGDALPSVRKLALEHAINAMTFSKAYSMLEADGYLTRRRGKGMVISETQAPESEKDRLQRLAAPMDQLILAAEQLGLTSKQLATAVRNRMEKKDV